VNQKARVICVFHSKTEEHVKVTGKRGARLRRCYYRSLTRSDIYGPSISSNFDDLERTSRPFVYFYVRQHICYSAYMPWQFRLSVRLSVTRVDQSKTVEVRITQFSLYSSPIPLVFPG